jgi:hypothetical protein
MQGPCDKSQRDAPEDHIIRLSLHRALEFFDSSNVQMDIHVDDLTEFIFQKNTGMKTFNLTLDGLETSKDLFFFILDLFCKGLVFLYGTDKTVDLSSVTPDMFSALAHKLLYAGISIHLTTSQVTDDEGRPRINIYELLTRPYDLALDEYKLELRIQGIVHVISFGLVR